jgi:hypothetical protein
MRLDSCYHKQLYFSFFLNCPPKNQRLDSFSELVSSSIEYGESTVHQVQPNKAVTLNIPLLERILVITKECIEEQSWKASTGKTQ